jgi:hypothetical protein
VWLLLDDAVCATPLWCRPAHAARARPDMGRVSSVPSAPLPVCAAPARAAALSVNVDEAMAASCVVPQLFVGPAPTDADAPHVLWYVPAPPPFFSFFFFLLNRIMPAAVCATC